jgi:hypothetical protein
LAAGLRRLGLDTWRPAIPESTLFAAGLKHLGFSVFSCKRISKLFYVQEALRSFKFVF